MILLIALLHAVPIFAAVWFTNSKAALWIAAVASAAVAVATGNSAYLVADLLAIGVALWNCLEVLKRRVPREVPPKPAVPVVSQSGSGGGSFWVGLGLLGCLFAFLFALPSSKAPTPATPSPQTPANYAPPPSNSASVARPKAASVNEQPRKQPKPATAATDRTVQDCLRIHYEKKMVACLETAK